MIKKKIKYDKNKQSWKNKYKKIIIKFIIILLFISFFWGLFKPLPNGVNYESVIYNISADNFYFLNDLTYVKEESSNTNTSNRIIEQEIFSNVFNIIENANDFIVIDMFLFGENDYINPELINVSTELTNKLVNAKINNPNLQIYFITDYYNTFYGTYKSDLILELEKNNISIIFTEINKLRDSNPIYSSIWRVFLSPFGRNDFNGGVIPNIVTGEPTKVAFRSLFELLNFKVNHRKIILSENDLMIISANPHTGSSLHSNVGFRIKDKILINNILNQEKLVAKFSNSEININFSIDKTTINNNNNLISNNNNIINIQYLTESKIRDAVINEISKSNKNEIINIGMFYLSHRDIINELKNALERGVEINLILDPNKDAFGRQKGGIPNRQVAMELKKTGANIRWYNTNGEQFHTKIFIRITDNKIIVILGSANYTKRNLDNYNLEANIWSSIPLNSEDATDILNYWDKISEEPYSAKYSKYEDNSILKYWFYRFQEFTGLCTF